MAWGDCIAFVNVLKPMLGSVDCIECVLSKRSGSNYVEMINMSNFCRVKNVFLYAGGAFMKREVAGKRIDRCMNRFRTMARAAILCCVLAACGQAPVNGDPNAGPAAVQRALTGKEIWEEKCRTLAGKKIYRTVENVDGLLLLKIRSRGSAKDFADRMWPGAAFAREETEDEYIKSFLGSEYSADPNGAPVSERRRGYISAPTRPGGVPGYQWVETFDEKAGVRVRVVGQYRIVGKKDEAAPNLINLMQIYPDYDLNIYGYVLEKNISNTSPPKYGVTFEDQVIDADRYFGIASSNIKVLDLESGELLGEMTRYAWSPGAPSKVNPSPWLTAYRCPGEAWTGADTRKFVDQILIPSGRARR